MERFRQACRSRGLKLTPQRTEIYKELVKAEDHPSIEAILKRIKAAFPNISFDTVYRTVISLSDIGLINIVEGYGGSKRFDPNTRTHHHFRCARCHKIVDFYNEYYDNIKIPEEIKSRFNILNKKVVLEGICGQCAKKK